MNAHNLPDLVPPSDPAALDFLIDAWVAEWEVVNDNRFIRCVPGEFILKNRRANHVLARISRTILAHHGARNLREAWFMADLADRVGDKA